MATIDSITLEVADVAAAERFYAAAFGVGDLLRLRASDAPTDGFRGFTVSLVVSQPSGVDALVARARDAGATVLQEPTKSLWGYGGSVQAPDGTVWTVASSSKKETGPPSEGVDDVSSSSGCTTSCRARSSTSTTASRCARASGTPTPSSTPGRSRSP